MAEPRVTLTLRLAPAVAEGLKMLAGPGGMNALANEVLGNHVARAEDLVIVARQKMTNAPMSTAPATGEVLGMADHPFRAQKTSAFRCENCGRNRAFHSKEA